MNTVDGLPTPDGVSEAADFHPGSFAGELAALANQFFTARPDAAVEASVLAHPLPSLVSGGLAPASALPPVPGPLQAPALPTSPAPSENQLRTLPVAGAAGVGLDSSVPLAASEPPSSAPYFLEIAGMPAHPSQGPALPASALAVPATSPPVAPGLFDAHAIKRDFPILSERVHGKQLVWLDNAATTQKPRAVIERLSYFYEHENSNIHRAAHALAARATDAYEGARDKVRRFLNAPSPNDIVFVRGGTEAINLVAQSFGRRNIRAGDEIVITWLEHHANIVPWQELVKATGARLRVAPVDDRGEVLLDEYERLLGPRTRLVAITHVSNALGTIVPVQTMTAMAHRHGARVLIDGAQAVSHLPVDVQALDCDFYCFSGHKVFGPTGIGALFGKAEVLEAMPPWQGGGNMINDVTFERTTFQPPPARFEAGTGNIADAVGLGAAIDYVTAIGMPVIDRYEHELLAYASERLLRVPGFRMIGTAREKASVLSFVLDGKRSEDVGSALDREGIAVRSGHHCAQPILRRFGLETSVRASLAFYNTCEDVDALVTALMRIQAGR
jgi:cysteine desulfurase/selenocysteine lyase